MDWNAYRELESEANADYDYVREAFGDTRVPDDWDEPSLSELMFARHRGAEEGGLWLETPDYCSGLQGWHRMTCPNQLVWPDEPPF